MKRLLPEYTVWDPPLVEDCPPTALQPSIDHSALQPTVDASALQPSLTLPTCFKDLKVKVTHVTSPGNICVQLLQYDTRLKRYQPNKTTNYNNN